MLYPSLQHRLLTQHEAVDEIIKDTAAAVLERIPAPGKWSAKDHVAHLAKYQPVFLERMNTILETDKPQFSRYVPENDGDFEAWRKKDIVRLLQHLRSDRAKLNSFFECLSEQQLKRKGVHPRFGELTIVQWTEFFLLHEAHHLFTVFQLSHEK